MITDNPLPAADRVAIECNILNTMRPPSVSEIGDARRIGGIHFDSLLKHRANDPVPWSYFENDKSIGFECKEMRWSNGTSIKSGVNASVGVVNTKSSPVSLTYPDALGAGIDVKILQDNYRWQKIVEIEALEALKDIPADAEYLEISFTLSSDFVLPEGIISERIPFGENSFIQPVKAWDSSQENQGEKTISGTFGGIRGNVLTKRIPVAWLKSAVYPVQVDTTITYGSENVFNSASSGGISVAALDSTHFVVVYEDDGNSFFGTAIVGVVSGTTISSYGAENVFNSAVTSKFYVAALDSTHFVVAYSDHDNSFFGTAKVGLTNGGTTISSYGAENVFNPGSTSDISIAVLDSTHFVVAYCDGGNSNYGTAVVGLTDGGTTISSYGAENVFNSSMAGTLFIHAAALDSTHFVVAFADVMFGLRGTAIVGVVSGTTINSYGAGNVFNSANTPNISVAALDSTHFVVVYSDVGNSDFGTAIVGLTDGGTTISSYGAENVFNPGSSFHISVTTLDSTHFVVVYRDGGNSDYGTAVVGEISGTTISSYSAESVFNSATSYNNFVYVLDSTHFVVAYKDAGNSSFGTGIVGVAEEAVTFVSRIIIT